MAKKKQLQPPSLEFIKITAIEASPLNPRKEFDQAELQSLSESIIKVGLIQPLTVRKAKIGYELICGERRLRASKLAGLTEVPCSVRVLTDAEAMELMITENLQRKDVHPLEEANAFRYMLENMRYEIADIAAKIGKNEPFVIRRLQLLNLVPDLAAIFKSNHLSIGHAELLSRLEDQQQQLWFTDKYSATWQGGQGTISQLKEWLSNKTENKLAKAIFKTDEVFEGAQYISPQCTACRLNSSVNQTLFPDTASEAVCNGPQCFAAKTNAEFTSRLNAALEDPEILIIGRHDWNEQDVVKKLKADGYTVLTEYNDYSTVDKPELEDYTEDIDREDFESHEEYEEAYMDAENLFSNDLAAFVTKNKTALGFDINTGKYQHITLISSKKTDNVPNNDPARELKAELAKLKQKFTRGRELDEEKVMGNYINHIRNVVTLPAVVFPDVYQLSDLETTALICVAYEKADWDYKRKVRQLLFKNIGSMSDNEQHFKLFHAIHDAPAEIRAQIVRNAIFNTFSGIFPYGLNGGVMFALSSEWESDQYNQFRETQNDIKARREAKLEPRIAELAEKIKEIETVKAES